MITKLFGTPTDPTEWNGTNPDCKLCDKEIEIDDDYCEDHQRCYYCGEREICEDECENQKLIKQYNRNREHKDHIQSINQIK